jgi:hypothetical protein
MTAGMTRHLFYDLPVAGSTVGMFAFLKTAGLKNPQPDGWRRLHASPLMPVISNERATHHQAIDLSILYKNTPYFSKPPALPANLD